MSDNPPYLRARAKVKLKDGQTMEVLGTPGENFEQLRAVLVRDFDVDTVEDVTYVEKLKPAVAG